MSLLQLPAATLAELIEVATPGGKPVTALPGETPRLPATTVLPVEVTVVAPQTPKVAAEPRLIAAVELTNRRTEVKI